LEKGIFFPAGAHFSYNIFCEISGHNDFSKLKYTNENSIFPFFGGGGREDFRGKMNEISTRDIHPILCNGGRFVGPCKIVSSQPAITRGRLGRAE
jgi:hypothetical protein